MSDKEVENLVVRSDGEWAALRAPAAFLPAPVIYRGESPLTVYRRHAAEGDASAERFESVADVPFPAKGRDVLLLVLETGDDLKVAPVQVDPERVSPGSYMLFNRTKTRIHFRIDAQTISIEPRGSQVFKPATRIRQTLPVQVLQAGDREGVSLVTSTWFHDPSLRALVFFVPGDAETSIHLRVVNLHPDP